PRFSPRATVALNSTDHSALRQGIGSPARAPSAKRRAASITCDHSETHRFLAVQLRPSLTGLGSAGVILLNARADRWRHNDTRAAMNRLYANSAILRRGSRSNNQ